MFSPCTKGYTGPFSVKESFCKTVAWCTSVFIYLCFLSHLVCCSDQTLVTQAKTTVKPASNVGFLIGGNFWCVLSSLLDSTEVCYLSKSTAALIKLALCCSPGKSL